LLLFVPVGWFLESMPASVLPLSSQSLTFGFLGHVRDLYNQWLLLSSGLGFSIVVKVFQLLGLVDSIHSPSLLLLPDPSMLSERRRRRREIRTYLGLMTSLRHSGVRWGKSITNDGSTRE
jgi:hypothetical protein